MSWINYLLDNPVAILGCIFILLWGLAAAFATVSGSGLLIEVLVWLSYWITQVFLYIGSGRSGLVDHHVIGHTHSIAWLPWGFLIGDVIFVSWIVWDGLLSSEARESRTREKKRKAAIAAIAARGGFTDPRRNRQAD